MNDWLRDKLLAIGASRPPDFQIKRNGDLCMDRWYIVPRNPVFNIYLHRWWKSDEGPWLHDHMYWNYSYVLDGCYFEHIHGHTDWCIADDNRFRLGGTPHRIELRPDVGGCRPGKCWSLFITGPRYRQWGFHTDNGWAHWSELTQLVKQPDGTIVSEYKVKDTK